MLYRCLGYGTGIRRRKLNMGYIDKKYGIKTANGLEKYIYKLTAKEVIVIKTADHLKVIWALGDKLHTHKIDAHVIYVVQEEALDEAIKVVMDSMTEHVTPKKPIDKEQIGNFLEEWDKKYGRWESIEPYSPLHQKLIATAENIKPISTSNSLHIHEEQYIIEDETYRFMYAIGSDNKPDIEVKLK